MGIQWQRALLSRCLSNMDWTQVRPWTPLFQYPHDGAGADRIIVTRSDYECLEADFSLNRTVFDFALRVIVADRRLSPLGNETAFINMACDVHAFPCDFFTMLSAGNERGKLKADKDKARRAYARVERWTRGVDVFAKRFLLVPVFEAQHWSLAIVCHPGELAKRAIARERREREGLDVDADEVDEGEDCPVRPCVIHMDSNRQHSAKKIEKFLRCFLELEWRKRHVDEPPFTCRERTARAGGPPADLLLAMPKVPLQGPHYPHDSGLYALRYAQEFLTRAVCRGAPLAVNGRDVSLDFRDHDFEAWFTGRDIAQMRRDFHRLVRDLKLEEDVRRFRARRRVCWIGQRDPASTLYCLPTDILKKLEPYFAL